MEMIVVGFSLGVTRMDGIKNVDIRGTAYMFCRLKQTEADSL